MLGGGGRKEAGEPMARRSSDEPDPRAPDPTEATSETSPELDELFDLLIEAAERGERFDLEAWLEGRPHLRSRAAELARLASAVAQAEHAGAAEGRPDVDGYTVLEEIGRGGMGAVFRALQHKPRRIVALKVIRGALTSASSRRRFEVEVDVLARLEHPGVARIYDAGVIPGSQDPYFAMELVEGLPLTAYVTEHGLSTPERLRLLSAICDAVEHAHQKGVIHRDLKPSNILVDAEGHPRILDFGVARLTDADLAVTSVGTDVGALVGTIPYMSPEQAGGDPDDLDTRSDVYALGVVAYEVLAGRLPYDVRPKMVHEAIRVIREEEPQRLSSADRTLRGDVETIIAKALEKEKGRRYQSALALGEDIRRYLADEPIAARPASATYQLRKFARRNRALVGGALAVLVVLLVGIAGTGWQAIAATRARDEARANLSRAERAERAALERAAQLERLAEFQASMLKQIDTRAMGDALFEEIRRRAHESMAARGLDETRIEERLHRLDDALVDVNATDVAVANLEGTILDRAESAVDRELSDQPRVAARMLQNIAESRRDLGAYERALATQGRALELREASLGPDHPETADAEHILASILNRLGRSGEAIPILRRALAVQSRALGEADPDVLDTRNSLAVALKREGEIDEPRTLLEEGLAIARAEDMPMQLAGFANNLADLFMMMSEPARAEPLFREALEASEITDGEESWATVSILTNLGASIQAQGDLDQAERTYREALDRARSSLGDDNPVTITCLTLIADAQRLRGDLDGAQEMLERIIEARARALGADHPDTLTSMNNLAYLHMDRGRGEQAIALQRRVVEGRARTLGSDHPETLNAMSSEGIFLFRTGSRDEAREVLERVLERKRRTLGERHPHTLVSLYQVAQINAAAGDLARAEELALECHEANAEVYGEGHAETIDAIDLLVRLYDARHAAEPEGGFDREAARWRRTRETAGAAT